MAYTRKGMKLLYLDFNLPYLIKDMDYPVGGAAVEWYAWIKGFVSNNHGVGLLTFKGAKRYINKELSFDIVETYGIDEGIPKLRLFYKRIPAIFLAVQRYKPDYLIQECAGFETGLMAFIAKVLGIPFVYRVANDIDTDGRYKERLTRYQQIAYLFGIKHADIILCQNNYQYKKIKEMFPDKNVAKIYNPYFNDGPLPGLVRKKDRRYVAWIGIFQKQKNLPALLEIARRSPDIEFLVAGSPCLTLDDETASALNKLKECRNVRFVGYLKRSEIIPFLSNAYALLNTSHYEGFSNTFLEAFLAGTPVVTTRKIDPDDIISNNGLGVISDDYDAIPALLFSLIKDRYYDDIPPRCRDYVLKNHDPAVLASRFINILEGF